MRSARRLAISARSSRRRTVKLAGLKECLRAFWEARDLPSEVRGPVDLAALARLAARRSAERGGFAIGFLRFRSEGVLARVLGSAGFAFGGSRSGGFGGVGSVSSEALGGERWFCHWVPTLPI